MNYIIFDLEWNQCPYGKERENRRLPFEIIEIGAVKLDEDRNIVDSFQEIIKPSVYRKLHFRTKEILKIDVAALNKGISFSKAVKKFLKWCGQEAKFCTWGSSDLVELQRNMKYYGILNLFEGPVFYYDVQKLFGLVYEGEKTARSLEYAIDFLEIGKEGKFHRALNDAYYTAEIFEKLPFDFVRANYSIDCYQNPKAKNDEIYTVFHHYSKFISREFDTKEEAMKDREITGTKCFLCGQTAKKKIRWFAVNPKSYLCLAYCSEHGYFKGKARIKKTDEGKYYVVKTLKQIDQEEAVSIREKKEALRKKRRLKRHQEKRKPVRWKNVEREKEFLMDNQVKRQENKMGVMPINKLLLSMSVPIMVSMLVQALYNIVDSMFVAQVNENALAAVSLVFPVQNLMISVAVGTGVGINALLSRCLGAKEFDKANKTASHGVLLAFLSYLVFAVFGIAGAGVFMSVQTQDPQIIAYGTAYLRICCVFSMGLFLQITFERLLQSTGKTFYSMLTQTLGAVINIILDPIMIFGLFGFPRMEVAGAAVATVTGQIIASGVAFLVNRRKNHEIHVTFRGFKWSGEIVKGIYAVGVPSIVMSAIGSVMTFGMNKILIAFSSTATAVFGVYFKLQSFIFMPVFGLNNGMVPIIAYNYGARKKERITRTITLSACYATGIMLLGMAVFQLLPEKLLGIFNASETMVQIGVPALRIVSLCFISAGFNIVCSSVYQALTHGMLSLWVSLVRQLCVLLPSAFILAKAAGLSAVWWSFPIAEVFSLAMCIWFLRHVYKKEIAPLGN